MNAYSDNSAETLLTPDSLPVSHAKSTATTRRPNAAVDVLRTWRLAFEVIAYNPAQLFVVAPALHDDPGLRIVHPDRSVDLVLNFDGRVWMHRPWKTQLDTGATLIRSLGTTRLAAARIVASAHVPIIRGASLDTPTERLISGVIGHLRAHARGSALSAQGWVVDGGGLRLDTARGARWLWGRVPLETTGTGPLPELPPSAWIWLAVDAQRTIVEWWSQRPPVPSGDEPDVREVTSALELPDSQGGSKTSHSADRRIAA